MCITPNWNYTYADLYIQINAHSLSLSPSLSLPTAPPLELLFVSVTLKESLKEVRGGGGEQRASLTLSASHLSGVIVRSREPSHGAAPRPAAGPS